MRERRAGVVGSLCALALAVAMGVSGCFGQPSSQGAADATAKFYAQKPTWKPCDQGLQCARVSVPEDWSKPGGATIHVGLLKRPATDGHAKGTIFFNPGGPGGSVELSTGEGDFAPTVDDTLENQYDIVGYDPPGVGSSTPITCGPGAELGKVLFTPYPGIAGSPQWVAAYEQRQRALATECVKGTGAALLTHVDTVSAARDLDVARAAVRSKQLNYLGYSYGTELGIVYESLFPDKIGRVVLDGVADPLANSEDFDVSQAVGTEKDVDDYLTVCAQGLGCPFAGSIDQMRAQLTGLLAQLGAHPAPTASGFHVDGETANWALTEAMATQTEMPDLTTALLQAENGDGDGLLGLAENYWLWSPTFTSANFNPDYLAIMCADHAWPSSEADMAAEATRLDSAAPILGAYYSYQGAPCAAFPQRPAPLAGLKAPAPSHPLLLVASTGDPETPLAGALSAHTRISDSRLLIRDGDGHTSYDTTNTCVVTVVDAYFLDGTLPKDNTHC